MSLFKKSIYTILLAWLWSGIHGQSNYWQQYADYTIRVSLNAANHTLSGNEVLDYTNHSPDTLDKVYYHLYFNAFQPNSEMDVRSRTIADPDSRVMDRIYNLKPDEIGNYQIKSIKQDGIPVKNFAIKGTILVV